MVHRTYTVYLGWIPANVDSIRQLGDLWLWPDHARLGRLGDHILHPSASLGRSGFGDKKRHQMIKSHRSFLCKRWERRTFPSIVSLCLANPSFVKLCQPNRDVVGKPRRGGVLQEYEEARLSDLTKLAKTRNLWRCEPTLCSFLKGETEGPWPSRICCIRNGWCSWARASKWGKEDGVVFLLNYSFIRRKRSSGAGLFLSQLYFQLNDICCALQFCCYTLRVLMWPFFCQGQMKGKRKR